MDNRIARQLRGVEQKYKDVRTHTGQVIVSDMARDAANEIERLESGIKDIGKECAKRYDRIKALEAELATIKSDIEAGRLVRLPCAIRQIVFVPTKDGGMYAPYVKRIAFLRPDAHDAVMEAVATVGLDGERLTFMIAPENKGTRWFETETEALAAMKEDAHG